MINTDAVSFTVMSKAARESTVSDSVELIQAAIGIENDDLAGIFFSEYEFMDWANLSLLFRCERLIAYTRFAFDYFVGTEQIYVARVYEVSRA